MTDRDNVFVGSLPECYDTLMVPLIFDAYAADMAARVAESSPGSVLETAAGTGALTRALAPKLGADAHYVVTDLNAPMLEFAAARQRGDARLEWKQADALALPFDDEAFDVVVCQFGAMFFPDAVRGYAEARRTLRPGGRFLFSVWDRIEENAFAHEVTQAVAEIFPEDPPRFLARTPHGHFDVERIRQALHLAGFSTVDVETRAKTSVAASAHEVAAAYCFGTRLRDEIDARDPSRFSAALARATAVIAERHGDGRIEGKIQAHFIVATP